MAQHAQAARASRRASQGGQGGQASGGIQLPAHPTPQEKKAAAELQHWIKEMTGATLEIASGNARGSGIAIRTDRVARRRGLRHRGRATAGSSCPAAGPAASINAVYALLEEDLGCRFYTNESIRLPKTDTLVIAPVARRYIPQLKIRDPFYACAFDPVWSLRNRTNAPDARVPEEYGGHVRLRRHVRPHRRPDRAAGQVLQGAPRVFRAAGRRHAHHRTSFAPPIPSVVKIAIEYVRQVLKDKPHTEIVSVSKNDIPEICHCERCTKLRDAEGSDMANQLFLVNQVAEAIEKEHPDVVIDTLAYLETIQVPKTVRPRKNVAIRLCNDAVGSWVASVHAGRAVRRGEARQRLERRAQPHLHLGLQRQLQPLPGADAEPGRDGGQHPLLGEEPRRGRDAPGRLPGPGRAG